MIPEDADKNVVELLRNHPKVIENPELLNEWVEKYYSDQPPKVMEPPAYMICQKRWSVFRKIWNKERNKYDKVVCTPTGGTPYPGYPNPENGRDFSAYADVKKLSEVDPAFAPAFYLMKKDRILFLDFDQPCDKPNYPTYTEKSISGGYHVFGWYDGEKPILPDTKEVYQDRRWIIVTGDVCDGKVNINDISDAISDRATVLPKAGMGKYASTGPAPTVIKERTRNTTLFSLACSLRAKGLSDAGIGAAIVAENQAKCKPPLPDDEVMRIIASACRYPPVVPKVVSGSNASETRKKWCMK